MLTAALAGVTQLVRVSFCSPDGFGIDSRSGHIKQLQERLLERKGGKKGVKKLLIGYSLKPSWLFVMGCTLVSILEP